MTFEECGELPRRFLRLLADRGPQSRMIVIFSEGISRRFFLIELNFNFDSLRNFELFGHGNRRQLNDGVAFGVKSTRF